jgi:serine/threonine protein kinase
VLRIGREVAEGLAAAHARGLVHRDVKPANIWLEVGRDRVKLVDFGLARGSGEDAHFTQLGAVIGTPAYMAPEQANGEEVDGRCDLFGLGAVLYRACTGELPFGGTDTLSVLKALATTTPEPPHQIDPALPRVFSDLVMGLLAKDRAERPESAREVVEALTAIERGDFAEEPPAPPEEIGPAQARERQEPVPPPAPVADRVRERGPAGSGVKRKGPKKGRPPRRKKRPAREVDWGRRVLVASLVLLAVSLLVLLLGILRHATRERAAGNGPIPVVSAGFVAPWWASQTRPTLRQPGHPPPLRSPSYRPVS